LSPALELKGIDKRFGAVHANRGVDFTARRGSIHGLIGENGAGKSTLMNIAYGYHHADSGEIRIQGRAVRIRRPHDAIAAGIGMVHQHFMLVEPFSVLENIVLGAEGGVRLKDGLSRARGHLERLARDYGLEAPLDTPVEDLPVGLQQRVEILKALYRGAEILILDEPTAVLTPQEADRLFALLDRLRSEGKTAILVTHKLREIMAITDAVTVMRQGSVVGNLETAKTQIPELAEKMVGRAVALRVEKGPAHPGQPLLEVEGLEVRDRYGVPRVRAATFSVRAGEIVAIAGVAGNGQSELLDALAGLATVTAGRIRIQGRLAHVPEDRLKRGVLPEFSAAANAILGHHRSPAYRRGAFLSRRAIREGCARKMASWDVRPPEPERPIGLFSGGNQQKLVLAREIDGDPSVLIVGQPTRGVDIGAIEFIHRRLVALRDSGRAILVVSVELDEVLGLADRILVMAGGEIVGELDQGDATEEKIGLLMAGIRRSESGPGT
jgi:ABC-type uncharacterized transport system ATPase subunit